MPQSQIRLAGSLGMLTRGVRYGNKVVRVEGEAIFADRYCEDGSFCGCLESVIEECSTATTNVALSRR
jgi:hypothetical protein